MAPCQRMRSLCRGGERNERDLEEIERWKYYMEKTPLDVKEAVQQKMDLASLFASFFAYRPSFSVFFFIFWTKWCNFTGWCYFRRFLRLFFLNLAQITAQLAPGFAPSYAPSFASGFATSFEPSFAPNFTPSLDIYSCCAPFYVHVWLKSYTLVFIHFSIFFYFHFCIPSCAKFGTKVYILF